MPRSIWNGTIAFGLTAVPIKVHSATRSITVHFRQVHARDGVPIKQKRICSQEDREVPADEVVRGYEVRKGAYVVLTPDEIKAAAGEASHLIELEEFVRAAEVDPVFYDRTYYLGAGSRGEDAYRLLHDALDKAERVGIGRWVFHNREYLVAIRPHGRLLLLHTLRFAAELVDPGKLGIPDPSRAPSRREIEMAGTLVDSLHGEFDPDAYQAAYHDRVLALIEARGRGEEPELPSQPDRSEEGSDLLAALEASLKGGG